MTKERIDQIKAEIEACPSIQQINDLARARNAELVILEADPDLRPLVIQTRNLAKYCRRFV